MGGVILKAMVALCFATLVLAACSEQPDEPDRGHNDAAASGGGAGETGKARTIAEKGALSPGRYSTGEEFEPSFSFEIGEGWRVLPSSTSHSLKLGYISPDKVVAEAPTELASFL